MNKFFIIFLLFFSLAGKSYSKTLYVFGSFGLSDYVIDTQDTTEISNKLLSLGFASATTSADTNTLGYKFGVGMNIPLLFSIEGSFANLGKISFSSKTTSPSENLSANVEMKGLNVDLLKNLGPFGFSFGLFKVNDTVKISSSNGTVDVPIDKIFLPKIGANINYKKYRLEFSRLFITPNSHINTFMIGYVFNLL